MKKSLLPASLKSSDAFIQDMARIFDLPSEVFDMVRGRSEDDMEGGDDSWTDFICEKAGIEPDAAYRLAQGLRFLVARSTHSPNETEDLLEEIVTLVGGELSQTKRELMLSAFTPTHEEVLQDKAAQAFNYADTYLASEFKAILSSHDDQIDDHLYLGFAWTVNYHDSVGEKKSISLNLSSYELKALGKKLLSVVEAAEKRSEGHLRSQNERSVS